jgi:hypothetical protein
MQESGTWPITLSKIIGHRTMSSIQMYAKVLDENRRDAVKTLEQYRESKVVAETAAADTKAHIN